MSRKSQIPLQLFLSSHTMLLLMGLGGTLHNTTKMSAGKTSQERDVSKPFPQLLKGRLKSTLSLQIFVELVIRSLAKKNLR